MFEQQRLRGEGADATGTEEYREGGKQLNREDSEGRARPNITLAASRCKTARHGRISSYYEFAPEQAGSAAVNGRGVNPTRLGCLL